METKNLLLLPLCLTLLPCSAQGASDSVDIDDDEEVVYHHGDIDAELEELSLIRKGYTVVEALRKLTDKGWADLFAKNCRAMLNDAMNDVLLHFEHSDKPSEGVKGLVKTIADTDTHGSEDLDRLLWGWKHMSGLLERDIYVGSFADCYHAYKSYAEAPAKLKRAIYLITSKLTADVNAECVEDDIRAVRGQDGLSRLPVYTPAPEEFKDWMLASFGSLDGVESQFRQLLEVLKDKGYFGSTKLEEAVRLMDAPVLPERMLETEEEDDE